MQNTHKTYEPNSHDKLLKQLIKIAKQNQILKTQVECLKQQLQNMAIQKQHMRNKIKIREQYQGVVLRERSKRKEQKMDNDKREGRRRYEHYGKIVQRSISRKYMSPRMIQDNINNQQQPKSKIQIFSYYTKQSPSLQIYNKSLNISSQDPYLVNNKKQKYKQYQKQKQKEQFTIIQQVLSQIFQIIKNLQKSMKFDILEEKLNRLQEKFITSISDLKAQIINNKNKQKQKQQQIKQSIIPVNQKLIKQIKQQKNTFKLQKKQTLLLQPDEIEQNMSMEQQEKLIKQQRQKILIKNKNKQKNVQHQQKKQRIKKKQSLSQSTKSKWQLLNQIGKKLQRWKISNLSENSNRSSNSQIDADQQQLQQINKLKQLKNEKDQSKLLEQSQNQNQNQN